MMDQNLKRRMELMSPRDLKQFAMMHKNDPFVVSMAVDIDNSRKAAQRQQAMQMGAAAQNQPPVVDQNLAAMDMPAGGIPGLPAQNMEGMADGGIVGYAGGGDAKAEGKESYREYAMRKAREYGLDPKFVDRIFEIESGYDPKAKSGTGPQGIGQLTSYIAKRFGISPKERTDPYKNIDASIGFMDYLNKKYKGDPAKVAVAYNQGEPVLDAHLKRNKGKLVPETLHEDVRTANKAEPAEYLQKMAPVLAQTPAAPREVPRTPEMLARQQEAIRRRKLVEAIPFLGAAQAAEPQMSVAPKQPAAAPDLSVPTPEAMAAERARAEAARNAPSSLWDKIYGGAEAAHATLLGAPATATGLIALDPVARYLEPKTEKGKEYAQDIHDFLTGKLKLPPYIAGVGVPRAPTRAPAAREAAGIAAETAKAARERAETAKAPRLPAPKAAKPTTPLMEEIQAARAADQARREFSVAPETTEVATEALNRRKLAEQAADVARAEKAAQSAETAAGIAGDEANAAALADRLLGRRQSRAAGLEALSPMPGLAGEAAGLTNVPPAPTPRAYEAWEPDFVDRDRTFESKLETKPEETPTPAAEAPAAKKTGLGALTDEDWLTMGLHMLQAPGGQAGSALSQLGANIGRSGLATLSEKRAREQREMDQAYKQTMEGYYKGLTGQLGRPGEEERIVQQIMKDKNVSFTEALRLLNEYKYAPQAASRMAVAEMNPQLQLLRQYGLLDEGGGLTPRGQDVFSNPKTAEYLKQYGG